jgi:DNA-binding CsgD family transcriptional regulator
MVVFTTLYTFSNTLWLIYLTGQFQGVIAEILLVGFGLGTLTYTYQLCREKLGLSGNLHGLVFHTLIITFLFARLSWSAIPIEMGGFILCYSYAQLVALFYGGRLFFRSATTGQFRKLMQVSLLIASCTISLLPFTLFFVQSFTFQYVLLNLGFFFILIAHLRESHFRETDTNPKAETTFQNNETYSRLDQFGLRTRSKQLEACQKQLTECLKQNNVLRKESAEKSKIIERYESKQEITIEEVLLPYDISPRQLEVVQFMVEGKKNDEIAEQLHLTESGVRSHLTAVYRKTGIRGAKKLRRFILNKLNGN